MLSESDTSFSKLSTRLSVRLKFQSLRTVPSGRMPLRVHAQQRGCRAARQQSGVLAHRAGAAHMSDSCGCGRIQVRAAHSRRNLKSSQNDASCSSACSARV